MDRGLKYAVGISNRLVGSMPRNDWVELFPRMFLKRDKNVCMAVYGGGRGGARVFRMSQAVAARSYVIENVILTLATG